MFLMPVGQNNVPATVSVCVTHNSTLPGDIKGNQGDKVRVRGSSRECLLSFTLITSDILIKHVFSEIVLHGMVRRCVSPLRLRGK